MLAADDEESDEARRPFDPSQMVRGTLRSPAEPLIDAARLQRSLFRGLVLGAALAPLGGALAGLQGAVNCLLFGLIAAPVAWVEFWAERRPGATSNDVLAGSLAGLVAALSLGAFVLQSLYLEAVLAGGGVAGFAQRLARFSPLDLVVFVPCALVVAAGYGVSVLRRLRRYLPRERRRELSRGRALAYGLAGTLALALLAGALPGGQVLFCPLLSAGLAYLLLVSSLDAVYRAADTIELELRLWRERRADP